MTAATPTARQTAMETLLAHPAARDLLVQPDDPRLAELAGWLGQLCLLHGVPFANMVPDPRMLPPESIRFFFLDQNWLDSLVDGALSIVAQTPASAAVLGMLRPQAQLRARAAAQVHRGNLLQVRRQAPMRAAPAPDPGEAAPVWSGFLLRSAVVADWPGLHVSGAAGAPLTALRVERLSPTVLIAIFDGIVTQVQIAKPSQGLHFGVEDEDLIATRSVGAPGPEAGTQLKVGTGKQVQDVTVTAPFRAGDRRVLDVRTLVQQLSAKVQPVCAPNDPTFTLGPAEFAIQMVAGAERKTFSV